MAATVGMAGMEEQASPNGPVAAGAHARMAFSAIQNRNAGQTEGMAVLALETLDLEARVVTVVEAEMVELAREGQAGRVSRFTSTVFRYWILNRKPWF